MMLELNFFPRETLDVLFFSGSGYVLSSGSLSSLQSVLPSLPALFKYDAIQEDIAMGVCMASIGARYLKLCPMKINSKLRLIIGSCKKKVLFLAN